jgi:hypothetical protein
MPAVSDSRRAQWRPRRRCTTPPTVSAGAGSRRDLGGGRGPGVVDGERAGAGGAGSESGRAGKGAEMSASGDAAVTVAVNGPAVALPAVLAAVTVKVAVPAGGCR